MQRMVGLVRRCVDDYHMIEPGETVAVGVSGGKDSLLLLTLLHALSEYHPAQFHVAAFTVDMGFEGMDFSPVEDYCKKLGVPYYTTKTEIAKIVFDWRKEQNPCSMCAKMRRGALNNLILEHGVTKVALGHHYDDAVETFLMSLLYEGRISCFEPVTHLDRTGVTQIRPMLYIAEKSAVSMAKKLELPVVKSTCPADKNTKREETKQLIAALSKTYPDLKTKVFGAMQRLPLPQWGVDDLRRRPLPEVE
ncbi:MAG: tRNA 2-thiocytidine(32) synthetase TtcA [Oscillospiraceae bacterium]|nr:tRNA 2-thiocytidine(32) synthetase TtcA [Oscillospiraceae bacterium]